MNRPKLTCYVTSYANRQRDRRGGDFDRRTEKQWVGVAVNAARADPSAFSTAKLGSSDPHPRPVTGGLHPGRCRNRRNRATADPNFPDDCHDHDT